MPEGDAVWRTARRLDAALTGRVLTEADLRWPRIATADLRGRATLEVVPRGKHLLHRIEGGLTLHSHLRMEGSWRVEPVGTLTPGRRRSRDVRALLATADHVALGLRLGMLDLVDTRRESEVVGQLGPDLLGADFMDQRQVVVDVLGRLPMPVGAALLDQRVVAGLGTIWVSETLHAEQVSPWQHASTLTPAQAIAVTERARALLTAAIGAHRPVLRAYGREHQPCPRCGTPIRVDEVGRATQERRLYWCPTCQRR